MAKAKQLDILALARFQAYLFLLLGFSLGVIYSFGGLILDILVSLEWVTTSETPGLSYGTVLAFGALTVMPIIGLVFGFVVGIISGCLYNLFSKLFKNIDFKIWTDK